MGDTGIYYTDGEIVAKSGDVVVYDMNDKLYLEIGPRHNLWTLESEIHDYVDQLGKMPFGNVLEIGLGLGIASRLLLSYSKVNKVTTIEINRDVIKVYNKIKDSLDSKLNFISHKEHKIINHDGLRYITHTQLKYDFIFVDHYTVIDDETLPEIEKLVYAGKKILNKNGVISGWYDKFSTEEATTWFNKIFKTNYIAE